jgi:putative restriction endonuclease
MGLESSVAALRDLLARLPARHRQALEWFQTHAGTEQPWPAGIPSSAGVTLLATRAKGIYKPNWSDYALSARQVLKSRYPEKGPHYREDGTCLYGYFQENEDPAARDLEFTNRGLLLCWRDSIPVGVMRQTAPKPSVRYEVLGLALVVGWDAGYFFFEGFGPDGFAHLGGAESEIELLTTEQERSALESRSFDATSVVDAREKVLAQIVRRRGQREFRERLLVAYDRRCAITNCDVADALEACHIVPYQGPATNDISNGLLLRADIHTLFDLGLIGVEPEQMTVVLSSRLGDSAYSLMGNVVLRIPRDDSMRPSREALRRHLLWAGL